MSILAPSIDRVWRRRTRLFVILALPLFLLHSETSDAAVGGGGGGTFTTTTSTTQHNTETTSQADVSASASSTRVVGYAGTLPTSPVVYDQTFPLPASDPTVVAAFADAAAAVRATGLVPGPPLQTSNTQSTNTVTTAVRTYLGIETTVTTTVAFGPATILIGPDQSITFFVAPGTTNVNTNTHSEFFYHTTVTVTATTTLRAVYQVLASNRPDPTTDVSVDELIDQQHDLVAAMADGQQASFTKRLNELHRVNPAGSSAGVVVVDAYAPGDTSAGTGAIDMALGPDGAMAATLGFWSDTRLTLTGPGGIAVDISSGTVTFGADYRFNDWATLGAGAGLSTGHTAVGRNGQQSSANAYYTAIYGSLLPTDSAFIDGVLGVGVIDLSSTRYVDFNDALAQGRRGGSQMFGSLAAGFDDEFGDLTLAGYGRIEATFSRLAAFTETGGGPGGALSFAAQDLWSVTALLGASAGFSFHLENGTLTPSVRAEYRHLIERSSNSSIAYVDIPAFPFALTGNQVAGDSLVLGIDTEFASSGGLTIALSGDLRMGQGGTASKSVSLYLGGQF